MCSQAGIYNENIPLARLKEFYALIDKLKEAK